MLDEMRFYLGITVNESLFLYLIGLIKLYFTYFVLDIKATKHGEDSAHYHKEQR